MKVMSEVMNERISEETNLLTKFFCCLQSLFQRTPVSMALCGALQNLNTRTKDKYTHKVITPKQAKDTSFFQLTHGKYLNH